VCDVGNFAWCKVLKYSYGEKGGSVCELVGEGDAGACPQKEISSDNVNYFVSACKKDTAKCAACQGKVCQQAWQATYMQTVRADCARKLCTSVCAVNRFEWCPGYGVPASPLNTQTPTPASTTAASPARTEKQAKRTIQPIGEEEGEGGENPAAYGAESGSVSGSAGIKMSTGVLIGVIVGGVVLVGLIVGIIIFVVRRRNNEDSFRQV
jgi:hypothetical protein